MTSRVDRSLVFGATLLLAVAAAACGDDDDNGGDTASTTATTAASTTVASGSDDGASDDDSLATTATTATSATTPATTSGGGAGTDGSTISLPVGTAGNIELAVSGDDVTIAALSLESGWQETDRSEDDGDVELDLQGDVQRIELDADVDDGVLDVDIDTRWTVASGTYVEPTLGGDVELELDEEFIAVASIDLADGWQIADEEQSSESIDVDLIETDSANTVEISGEIDDAEVELETDSRISIAG